MQPTYIAATVIAIVDAAVVSLAVAARIAEPIGALVAGGWADRRPAATQNVQPLPRTGWDELATRSTR